MDDDENGRDELKSEDEAAAAILVIYIARHYSKQYGRLC